MPPCRTRPQAAADVTGSGRDRAWRAPYGADRPGSDGETGAPPGRHHLDLETIAASFLTVVSAAAWAVAALSIWFPLHVREGPGRPGAVFATAAGTFLATGLASVALHLARRKNRRLAEENRALRRQVGTDGLTGLSSRRAFDVALDRAWADAASVNGAIALILIDVDHFKPFNDTNGHLEGDRALRAIGIAIADAVSVAGTGGAAFRHGGEEFAILLPQADEAAAAGIAAAVRDHVADLRWPHPAGRDGILTVSLGVACVRAATTPRPELLVEAADRAMYRAKQSGRGQVRVTLDARAFRTPRSAATIDGVDVVVGGGEVVRIDRRVTLDDLRHLVADIAANGAPSGGPRAAGA